ncbi:hypothetical protein ACW14Y_40830 [Kitasatospora sp. cg17-2]
MADWITDVCGWQDQIRTLRGTLPSQLGLVRDGGWQIGIGAHPRYRRVQLCPGRITDGTVDATGR